MHRVPRFDDRGPEPESDAVHEPFTQHPSRIEALRTGGDEPRHRARRIVAELPDELRKIVAGTDRHDAEGGIGARAQQAVRHFMNGAVPTDRDHMPGALPDRLRRQLLAVAGAAGAGHIHRPALRPKRPRDHGLGASCGASSRRGIEDDVGMKHAADKIQSRLPRKDLPILEPD